MARTIIEAVNLGLRARHPAGRRARAAEFLDRLLLETGDGALPVKGSAFPLVHLPTSAALDSGDDLGPAALAAALPEGLRVAARWRAKQSPAVFDDLRRSVFLPDVLLFVSARVEEETLDLPPEFLAGCARLGLGVSVCVSNPGGE